MSISYLFIAFLTAQASSIPLVLASCHSRFDTTCETSNMTNIIVIAFSLFAFILLLSCCCIYNRHKRVRQSNLSYIRNAQAQAARAPQNDNKFSFNPMYTQQPSYNPTVYSGPWPAQNPPPPVYMAFPSAPSPLPPSTISPSPPVPAKDAPQYPPPSYVVV